MCYLSLIYNFTIYFNCDINCILFRTPLSLLIGSYVVFANQHHKLSILRLGQLAYQLLVRDLITHCSYLASIVLLLVTLDVPWLGLSARVNQVQIPSPLGFENLEEQATSNRYPQQATVYLHNVYWTQRDSAQGPSPPRTCTNFSDQHIHFTVLYVTLFGRFCSNIDRLQDRLIENRRENFLQIFIRYSGFFKIKF